MAKINARGARQIGPTFYTEKDRPGNAHDVERTYYEAWRLRSDGKVMTRIIRTFPTAADSIGHTTEHRGSTFRIVATMRTDNGPIDSERLRAWLERKGYRIVKTSY